MPSRGGAYAWIGIRNGLAGGGTQRGVMAAELARPPTVSVATLPFENLDLKIGPRIRQEAARAREKLELEGAAAPAMKPNSAPAVIRAVSYTGHD